MKFTATSLTADDNVAHWPDFPRKKINVDFMKLELGECIVGNKFLTLFEQLKRLIY